MNALRGEYSLSAAARLLRIDRKTLARWLRDGRVRARRTVTGRVYIARAEVERLDPTLATVSPPEIRDATRSTLSRLFGTPMHSADDREGRR